MSMDQSAGTSSCHLNSDRFGRWLLNFLSSDFVLLKTIVKPLIAEEIS